MTDISFWLEPIKSHVMQIHNCDTQIPDIKGIRFIEADESGEISDDYIFSKELIYLSRAGNFFNSCTNFIGYLQKPVIFLSDAQTGFIPENIQANIILTDLPIMSLYNLLAQRLEQFKPHGSKAQENFEQLIKGVLDGEFPEHADITGKFSLIDFPPKKYYRFILIDFENKIEKSKADLIAEEVKKLFSGANSCVYNNQILILASNSDQFSKKWIDEEKFRHFLYINRARAMLGNPSSHYYHLKTSYLLCKKALDLALRLKEQSNERIFYFDDYAEYLVIDMCRLSYESLVGHSDLIYTTQPELLKIYRYDCEQEDHLASVLYHYCLSNCNITRTAEAVFMHRNTVSAKINKIKELVNINFADGNIQQRIIFSYRVLKYAEIYGRPRPSETFCNARYKT